MIDLLASICFIVLLTATATLKLLESKNTQQFKYYLLLATLFFLTSKIYNAIKYYEGVRTRAAHEDKNTQQENNNASLITQKILIVPTIKLLHPQFSRNPSIFRHVQGYLRNRKKGSEFARTYSP